MRNKIKKFLGKVEFFTGTVHSNDGLKVLLMDVKHANKIIADHLWIQLPMDILYTEGDTLRFRAKGKSYIDSKGVRKYGLGAIHKVRRVTENVGGY